MIPNIRFAVPNEQTIMRVQLDNGVTVLVYENPDVQSVYLMGALHAGSIYEDHAQNGLASMTAAALMHGTVSRDFDSLHASLEDIGADLGVGCGVHRVTFSGKSLAEDLPVVVELLADILRSPGFPEDQLERLRGERLTGLRYYQQDTRWRASRAFRETLYPENHAYHYDTIGSAETVPTLTPDMIRSFHQTHYGPQGMHVVVVGAVEAVNAVDIVRQFLGDWTNPNQPRVATLPDISPPETPRRATVIVPGKSQADIVIGTLGPSRFEPDFQAANLANSILGQFGMMGRIGNVVRERNGMAYYAGSRLEGGYGPGSWRINAGVDPANIERTIALCIEEIQRLLTEPVSEEDLADNQSYFTGHLPLQLESNKGLAMTLHIMESYGLGLNYLADYHDMIYSITREDLLAAAQHYLNPDALVIAVAGPNGE
jgi:zinc protease